MFWVESMLLPQHPVMLLSFQLLPQLKLLIIDNAPVTTINALAINHAFTNNAPTPAHNVAAALACKPTSKNAAAPALNNTLVPAVNAVNTVQLLSMLLLLTVLLLPLPWMLLFLLWMLLFPLLPAMLPLSIMLPPTWLLKWSRWRVMKL